MAHWRTVNLALIRGSQAINGASEGVRIPEEGAVRGYAARQRFRCVGTVKVCGASEAAGA